MSADVIAQVSGAVSQAVYGPTGAYWRLPAAAQDRMDQTPIDVLEMPSRADLAALAAEGIEVSDPMRLMGLYTRQIHRPGHPDEHASHLIQVFALPTLYHQADPADVVIHEIGHAAFDQPDYDANGHAIGAVGFVAGTHDGIPVHVSAEGDQDGYCPFCELDGNLARAAMALDGLRQRAHLQHRIPMGLGGRIPETSRYLATAMSELNQASSLMPDRPGETRAVSRLIEQAQAALSGENLTPDDVSSAYHAAYRAWDAGYDFGHVFQLRSRYGMEVA